MTTDISNIYENILKLVQAGDKEKAMAYMKEHWDTFPEELQEELTVVFFEDAIKNQAAEAEAISELQKEGIEVMDTLNREKHELEDALKAENIKDGIKTATE